MFFKVHRAQIYIVFLLLFSFSRCSQAPENEENKEIVIGNQVWMSKNLNVSTFRNGDEIPHARSNKEWEKASDNKQPAWCFYGNDSIKGKKVGKLYNWYAVYDPRGIAPPGYHVPSNDEWEVLSDFLGNEKVGDKLKMNGGWSGNGNGTNEFSFSAHPGGYRGYNGAFHDFGKYGYWWCSSDEHEKFAWFRFLYYASDGLKSGSNFKERGMSVRCIKDNP